MLLSVDTLLLLALVALAVAYLFVKRRSSSAAGPPGPWGLPVVGYLPFLSKPAHLALTKLADKYGPVVNLRLGSHDCVVLSSIEALKDSFVRQSDVFSGRPEDFNVKVYEHETAFVYVEGAKWKDLRTFCVNTLKELGFGRQSLEPVVHNEIEFFVDELEKQSRDGMTPVSHLLGKSVGNSICSLLLGYRCDYDDPWLCDLIKVVDEIQETYVNDIVMFFPWFKKIPIVSKLFDNPRQRLLKEKLWAFWEVKIAEYKKLSNDAKPQCFMTFWLEEQEKREAQNSPDAEAFSHFSLLNNVDVLCQVSFETTSTTLQWALKFVVSNPDVQNRLHAEIDQVIGKERVPVYADAKDMPYTKAFIAETHRKASLVPLGVFHANREAASVMGYHIPKRSMIIPNLWAVHHDPAHFKDPNTFDPTRFLDVKGEFIRDDSVVPFSLGKRFCPGEFVAQMQIFLYLTCLLQKFEVEKPKGVDFEFSEFMQETIVLHPAPFSLCLHKRK